MAATSPLVSPSSDKRFWSTLRNRVETLLETRNSNNPTSIISTDNGSCSSKAKRLKDDSMLLFRGFDSISYSISQLNHTLDTALQGARELAKPPTLTDIVQSSTDNTQDKDGGKQEYDSENAGQGKAGKKRKMDDVCSSNQEEKEQKTHLEKVKNVKTRRYLFLLFLSFVSLHLFYVPGIFVTMYIQLAVSMAAKSASLARELTSVKSDLCFMQERCALLQEENRRLKDGICKDNRLDEDDLVRLQLEALLAEKSRLGTENANLTRENQCLRQLVEYHQFATQDLSASYEQAIQGLGLDFSSPIDEEPKTPTTTDSFEFQTPLERFSLPEN